MNGLQETNAAANGNRAFAPIVIDVDGSVAKQIHFLEQSGAHVISLQDKSEELRYWTTHESLEWLKRLFTASVGDVAGKVIFYGSGDYHNLAFAWLGLVKEPITVIHFDNHTDTVKGGKAAVEAGSWVNDALELPHVEKIFQIGVDGDLDVNAGVFITGTPLPIGPAMLEMKNIGANRQEVYPTAMQFSTLAGRVPAGSNPSVKFTPGVLTTRAEWKNIRNHGGIEAVMTEILDSIETDAVYLTIDKDALREADSFTNYFHTTQGDLTLDELLTAIKLIGSKKRIVAADVCGDGSYPVLQPLSLKHLFFLLKDRNIPRSAFVAPEYVRLNETANLQILQALSEAAASGTDAAAN